MARRVVRLLILLGLVGCGESPRPRASRVAPTPAPAAAAADARGDDPGRPLARPARAIATH